MSEWQLYQNTKPTFLIAGHSHAYCFIDAINNAKERALASGSVAYTVSPQAGPPVGHEYWNFVAKSGGKAPVSVIWNGNQSVIDFLFETAPPLRPAWADPKSQSPGTYVSAKRLREFWSPTFDDLEKALGTLNRRRVSLLGTPPPKSERQIRESIEREPFFQSKLAEIGQTAAEIEITPLSVRITYWELAQHMLKEVSNNHSLTFIPVPDIARSSDGSLLEELSAGDVTHANAAFGEIMLTEMLQTGAI